MYEVYRHHDTTQVGLIDGILTSSGIETFIRNWVGSNITEIPIPVIYPAVCVLQESDVPRAKELILEFSEATIAPGEDWRCESCGEVVDGFLSECWSCQKSKPRPDPETR